MLLQQHVDLHNFYAVHWSGHTGHRSFLFIFFIQRSVPFSYVTYLADEWHSSALHTNTIVIISTSFSTLQPQATRLRGASRTFFAPDVLPSPQRNCRVLCTLLTNDFKQQSPSNADSSSASQEIPRITWNEKVHYRIHNSPPCVYTMSHINPVHDLPAGSLKIHLRLSTPRSPRLSLYWARWK